MCERTWWQEGRSVRGEGWRVLIVSWEIRKALSFNGKVVRYCFHHYRLLTPLISYLRCEALPRIRVSSYAPIDGLNIRPHPAGSSDFDNLINQVLNVIIKGSPLPVLPCLRLSCTRSRYIGRH